MGLPKDDRDQDCKISVTVGLDDSPVLLGRFLERQNQ